MKRSSVFVLIAFAVIVLSVGFVSAGPIVPKDVGADAKWFGHVDFEAVHSMKLVQDLKGQCPVRAGASKLSVVENSEEVMWIKGTG